MTVMLGSYEGTRRGTHSNQCCHCFSSPWILLRSASSAAFSVSIGCVEGVRTKKELATVEGVRGDSAFGDLVGEEFHPNHPLLLGLRADVGVERGAGTASGMEDGISVNIAAEGLNQASSMSGHILWCQVLAYLSDTYIKQHLTSNGKEIYVRPGVLSVHPCRPESRCSETFELESWRQAVCRTRTSPAN